ncbi:molybdopterin molybdotransferase MoeA [Pedobacter agri]|uniref:molybdopterin molybdotransferase MoeA n=1 Tax=Pedobacter agri TaxID=454586 RepID=UPI0027801AA4|nr:gephyrin-like molybdotransferase Glp [Pedobacter agri]MDQ1142485.1 molybdopterin molybdotransferase [Pedobacter agri]
MISVHEAKALIANNIHPLSPVKLPLSQAHQYILAEDVFAICDIPAYEQSSMDGYAIRFAEANIALELNGEMAAGTNTQLTINAGQASRIFTGAPLPSGADTVVMQEKTEILDGKLVIQDTNLSAGLNVRKKGAEMKTGALAMRKGDYLSPAALGFLAGIGITGVSVFPMPKVSIILTGKELVQPGETLAFGQVYESNSYSLKAALNQEGINQVEIFEADDDLEVLTTILQKALKTSDIVLLTGGVSVGDYDFVLEASARCGIQKVFHKVKQKPGKPLFFGRLEQQYIFGLPGNPSSVLSCFYNYVLPTLAALSGKINPVKEMEAELSSAYKKSSGLTHFLKAHYQNGKVIPLGTQESFRLSTFAQANCLIMLEEETEKVNQGERVKIMLLP